MEETDKLWSEYGQLQAQREVLSVQHQQVTDRMRQIHQKIGELTLKKKADENNVQAM